jgi:glycosyltransferase involved in cell wall biosynthesis
MSNSFYHFKDVTLLVTHYNRSSSLARLLKAFSDINCSFGNIVVSDDGSKKEHLEKVQQLQDEYNFRLITTPVNKGLGNNINKGQDAVKTKYTLYIQEDFIPKPLFGERFKDAVEIMEKDESWDIIRFYAYFRYPVLKPYNKDFSEMKYSIWTPNHIKFFFYSDHPHLRRSSFFQKFGRYAEGVRVDATEYRMALSFIKHKAKGLFLNDFTSIIDQYNTHEEPSTVQRGPWYDRKGPVVSFLRNIYLPLKLVKCTCDVYISKYE